MSHVPHTYARFMLHMHESRYTSVWVMSHTHLYESCPTHICMGHDTRRNDSLSSHTSVWVTSCHTHICMSHDTRRNDSLSSYTSVWVMSHTHLYESCHTHICMCHVTHRNDSLSFNMACISTPRQETRSYFYLNAYSCNFTHFHIYTHTQKGFCCSIWRASTRQDKRHA